MIPKENLYRNPAITEAANGAPCANCGTEDGTIVWAHSNMGIHGKGKSMKAHDCLGAELCVKCHAWLDQGAGFDPTNLYCGTRPEKEEMFRRAMERTLLRRFRLGVYRVAA